MMASTGGVARIEVRRLTPTKSTNAKTPSAATAESARQLIALPCATAFSAPAHSTRLARFARGASPHRSLLQRPAFHLYHTTTSRDGAARHDRPIDSSPRWVYAVADA